MCDHKQNGRAGKNPYEIPGDPDQGLLAIDIFNDAIQLHETD